MEYRVHLIKDPAHSDARKLLPFAQGPLSATFGSEGAEVFGVFQALFGLATNELYVIASADSGVPDIATETEVAGYQLVETVDLEPTVRPLSHSPLAREGLYVFRWFEVHNQDIDEIVALSETAWTSFESDFEAQVQGLFANPDRSPERGRMLLLSWYSGLDAWQTSRASSPEARENFIRRHELTLEAMAVATRLLIG